MGTVGTGLAGYAASNFSSHTLVNIVSIMAGVFVDSAFIHGKKNP